MKSRAKLSSPLWSGLFMAWTLWMNFLRISTCSILPRPPGSGRWPPRRRPPARRRARSVFPSSLPRLVLSRPDPRSPPLLPPPPRRSGRRHRPGTRPYNFQKQPPLSPRTRRAAAASANPNPQLAPSSFPALLRLLLRPRRRHRLRNTALRSPCPPFPVPPFYSPLPTSSRRRRRRLSPRARPRPPPRRAAPRSAPPPGTTPRRSAPARSASWPRPAGPSRFRNG